jgi:predicted RND superfamily exporter protein
MPNAEEDAATSPSSPGRARLQALFAACLGRRGLLFAALVCFTGGLAVFAARVQTDPSVEAMFPVWDEQRRLYDRFKDAFPLDDARALVILEGEGLMTPQGFERVRSLEAALFKLRHVKDVEGPYSVDDIRPAGETIQLEPLFDSELTGEEFDERLKRARGDPLFAWRIVNPDRPVVTVSVLLEEDAATGAATRAEFYADAQALLRERASHFDRAEVSGIPAIRARYIAMVNDDMGKLLPLALLVILLILAFTYRSPVVLGAAAITMILSVLWTVGVMGIFGVPMGILTSFAPIIVMVISISDTVHIATELDGRVRSGESRAAALAATLASAAGPCLLTEITIACGFLSLALVNIAAIVEFGTITAAGMLLAWLANMTVLPLVLSLQRESPEATEKADSESASQPARAGLLLRVLMGFIGWVERLIIRRPRRIVFVAVILIGGSIVAGSNIRVRHLVFDDLVEESEFFQDLRFAEAAHGGLVPVAVFLEPDPDVETLEPTAPIALEPAALRFLDEAERELAKLPGSGATLSPAKFLRKAHRGFAGEVMATEDGGLPRTRALAVTEIDLIDDGRVFRDVLTFDRRHAAAVTVVPDLPSDQLHELIGDLEDWTRENTPVGYRARVTGVLAIANRINEIMLGGLVRSFATAMLVTFLVFCLVLRSPVLAVVGIIPNVTPVAIMLGVMALIGIDLKPSTVLLFSMVLTIADDDTIQYLTRYRRAFKEGGAMPVEATGSGRGARHLRVAIEVLRETGLPMFVTAVTVSAGFLVLTFSGFEGTRTIGLITAVTLFSAVFADVFLAPVLLAWVKPRLGQPREAGSSEELS